MGKAQPIQRGLQIPVSKAFLDDAGLEVLGLFAQLGIDRLEDGLGPKLRFVARLIERHILQIMVVEFDDSRSGFLVGTCLQEYPVRFGHAADEKVVVKDRHRHRMLRLTKLFLFLVGFFDFFVEHRVPVVEEFAEGQRIDCQLVDLSDREKEGIVVFLPSHIRVPFEP